MSRRNLHPAPYEKYGALLVRDRVSYVRGPFTPTQHLLHVVLTTGLVVQLEFDTLADLDAARVWLQAGPSHQP